MGNITLLFVAFGLAMDAFSVAITSGIMIKKLKTRDALMIGLYFGGFQAIMPCIGWVLGSYFKQYIESIDHWIAFVLLGVIGGKMIWEIFMGEERNELTDRNPLEHKVLCLLAVATSIDALVVGITLAVTNSAIIYSSVVIGVVAFVLSAVGVWIGNKCGNWMGKKAELIGGLVLIGIGTKILIEHLCA